MRSYLGLHFIVQKYHWVYGEELYRLGFRFLDSPTLGPLRYRSVPLDLNESRLIRREIRKWCPLLVQGHIREGSNSQLDDFGRFRAPRPLGYQTNAPASQYDLDMAETGVWFRVKINWGHEFGKGLMFEQLAYAKRKDQFRWVLFNGYSDKGVRHTDSRTLIQNTTPLFRKGELAKSDLQDRISKKFRTATSSL